MTFQAANARANLLARALVSRGVGPDVSVAVLLDRSLDLPVADLAVLKAGGCFVPLDPSFPPERLAGGTPAGSDCCTALWFAGID
jgi:non-ribosomal peptide synthetase component F